MPPDSPIADYIWTEVFVAWAVKITNILYGDVTIAPDSCPRALNKEATLERGTYISEYSPVGPTCNYSNGNGAETTDTLLTGRCIGPHTSSTGMLDE